MSEKKLSDKIEQNSTRYEYERGYKTAQYSLELGKIAMEFRQEKRVPRYADGERESNVEHSYMLGLVAPEIINAIDLPLDTGLCGLYAYAHDLIELETHDVPTFLFTEDQQLQKEINEQEVLRRLYERLPPVWSHIVAQYEHQADPEARFVRYVDKLLPIVVDTLGAGTKVMREDYGVTSIEALRKCHADLHARIVKKFGNEFPELDLAHQLLCELFQQTFENELAEGL